MTTDPSAWVEAHGDILFRFALARLGDAGTAEDAVQETLLAAWQGRSGFRGEAAERTWLIGILRNKIIDHHRRSCRELPLSADEEGDAVVDSMFAGDGHFRQQPGEWHADPARLIEDREFWKAFTACREALPQRQAALFSLRVLDEVAPGELCREFGLSPGNLGVLLHRARIRLRACLESNWFKR